MRKLTLVCLAVAAIVSSDTSTNAAPVNLQLTLTTDSAGTFVLSFLGGVVTSSVPFDFSGSIDVTIDDSLDADLINDSTGIAITGANINIADVTVDVDASFLGGLIGEFIGVEINTLTSNGNIPLTTTVPANPFEYTFDPGGGAPTQLSIDDGLFTYIGTGPAGGVDGIGVFDFSTDPIDATLGSVGQFGMVTQAAVVSDGLVYVTVSAPITFSDFLATDPATVGADLSGTLVATGVYPIPEPSTVVLLGIAIVGLLPLWRRLRK